ncbi:hypothetical protein [Xenorhabdus khoisanae]|uniref:hypothetical protein n=1 Tax=Xenorhabdus khoisanae TaxID=880157 RepID=UPI0023588369|nr:hypothetical protein [Xenorhabdus khoisanae]
MLMENILRDVIQRTKNAFMGGSANKFHFETKNIDKLGHQGDPISFKLQHLISSQSNKLSKTRFNDIRDSRLPQLYQYINEIKFKMNLVGNCSEHCTYAFHYLMKWHSFAIFNLYKAIDPDPEKNIYIVIYETTLPKDHSFITISHLKSDVFLAIKKGLFSHILPDSWICDPWTEIACKGKDYPLQWKRKMKQWESESLFVATESSKNYSNAVTNKYDGFFSPTRPEVYNMISPYDKFKPAYIAFIDGKGNINTLNKLRNDLHKVPYNISEIEKKELLDMGFPDIDEIR